MNLKEIFEKETFCGFESVFGYGYGDGDISAYRDEDGSGFEDGSGNGEGYASGYGDHYGYGDLNEFITQEYGCGKC